MPQILKFKEVGVLLALMTLMGIFALLSENFLSPETVSAILKSSAEIGIVALGVTMLMIAGEYDLSIGSNFALSGMVFALLTSTYGMNSFFAFVMTISCGAFIGFMNAWVTLKTRIPSFITTLGTMLMCRGLVLIVTDGFPIAALEKNGVMAFFTYDLSHGFKTSLILWLALSLLFLYLLNFHPFGNVVMATGGNEEASYAMGIKVFGIKLTCFVIAGALAACSGVVQYSHLMSLSPTAGEQYELRAIAIAVIGGTALKGGKGTVLGTFLGTLIMGVLASGLVQAGVSTYWFRALIGLILVLAVLMNTGLERLKEKVA